MKMESDLEGTPWENDPGCTKEAIAVRKGREYTASPICTLVSVSLPFAVWALVIGLVMTKNSEPYAPSDWLMVGGLIGFLMFWPIIFAAMGISVALAIFGERRHERGLVLRWIAFAVHGLPLMALLPMALYFMVKYD